MSHSGKKKSHSYNFCLFSCFGPAGRRIPVNQDMDKGSATFQMKFADTFQMKFAEYVQVPADVQTKLLAEYAAQEQEED